jgi:predicted 3-demethylubiquinone-9 3-methyltransferase (glyoxalase superfamily)
MQKITPFLWFDSKAEEAMNFYIYIFKNSKVGRWQIIPSVLGAMLQDKKGEKAKSVVQAMLQMDKIDIQGLKQAYDRG